MAQTQKCLLYGGPYTPPFGDCAIDSETSVNSYALAHDSVMRFGFGRPGQTLECLPNFHGVRPAVTIPRTTAFQGDPADTDRCPGLKSKDPETKKCSSHQRHVLSVDSVNTTKNKEYMIYIYINHLNIYIYIQQYILNTHTHYSTSSQLF